MKNQPKTVFDALYQAFSNVVWLCNFERLETWETSELMRPLYQAALLLGFAEHEIEDKMFDAAFDEYDYFDNGLTDFVEEVWRQILADDQDIAAHVQEVYARNNKEEGEDRHGSSDDQT